MGYYTAFDPVDDTAHPQGATGRRNTRYCTNCGAELNENAVICVRCGAAVQTVAEDKVNAGLVVLSVFIPLFGIIYWAVKAKEFPRGAKACGIAGLISWGVNILLAFIIVIASAVIASRV